MAPSHPFEKNKSKEKEGLLGCLLPSEWDVVRERIQGNSFSQHPKSIEGKEKIGRTSIRADKGSKGSKGSNMSCNDSDSNEAPTGCSAEEAALFSRKLCVRNLRSGYKMTAAEGINVRDLEANVETSEQAVIEAGQKLKASMKETADLTDLEVERGGPMVLERGGVFSQFQSANEGFIAASEERDKLKSRLGDKNTLNMCKPSKVDVFA